MTTAAESFLQLFRGNPAAHYTRQGGKYERIDGAITLADVERHVRGDEPSVLSIPILPDANCFFGALDVDRHLDSDAAVDHAALAKQVTRPGLPLVVCRSKNPKSAHLWLFFSEQNGVSAALARRLLERYNQVLAIPGEVELFPKSETLAPGQIGNGINLPYFGAERGAFGVNGEALDLAGFLQLAGTRRAFGQLLERRDLVAGNGASGAAPATAEDRALPRDVIQRMHAKNLEDLRAAPMHTRNDLLNAVAFFAARAFAAKAIGESEGVIKNAIKQAALACGLDEREIEITGASGWGSGITQPLKLLDVATPGELTRPDMPASVLDGRLGAWCRDYLGDFATAYAWPALLAAASVLVKQPKSAARCNLFVATIGRVNSGKSQAFERACLLLQLEQRGLLIDLKSGSAEGFVERVGDRKGACALWTPDELAHVLEKAQIQGASFPSILNSIFYKDQNSITVAHRKFVEFNARITLAGGLVEENFDNCFGAETTFGLYDRFLFGVCPSGFSYSYRPPNLPDVFEKDLFGNAEQPAVEVPRIDDSVWSARDEIRKAEQLDNRVLEIALRVALICAAWDGKTVLRASDLGPAWEMARYQQRVRALFKPNPGRNFEAVAAYKVYSYLKQHADGGKWIAWRDVIRATHVMEYGPSTVDRAISSMVFSGEIERTEVVPNGGGRRKIFIRLAVE
jgi:TOTE conflict system, Archaeo-Eukaryotic Primase domain